MFANAEILYNGRRPNLNDANNWDWNSDSQKEADSIIGIQYFANKYGLAHGGLGGECIVIGTAVKIEKI